MFVYFIVTTMYDECMVRYAHWSFIATNNETLGFQIGNPSSVKEDAGFKQVLDSTLSGLITRTSNVTVSRTKHTIRGLQLKLLIILLYKLSMG